MMSSSKKWAKGGLPPSVAGFTRPNRWHREARNGHHGRGCQRDGRPTGMARFHAGALAAGGTDNGPPGERPYHPGYYAAFVLDPAGNNIEAVYHGPGKKSADEIRITF